MAYDHKLFLVREFCKSIKMSCLGNHSFELRIERDNKDPERGRIFLQVSYISPDTKTGIAEEFRGRKFYLSDHMIQDEIVKTAYLAFKLAVEHEVLENFTIDGKILFNPHTPFQELLKVSDKEVSRPKPTTEL
jgi:hypothetical protein